MSVETAGLARSLISVDEVSKHNSLEDLWLVVDGTVYDLSDFVPEHPGGPAVLMHHAGRDATAAYSEVHSMSLIKNSLPAEKIIGRLDAATVTDEWAKPPVQAAGPPRAESEKPALENLINAHDFELAAEKSFTPKAWAFASSAATGCITKGWNASRYSDIVLRPRVLRDVSKVDIRTTMLGHKMPTPIFCAPTSMGKLFHPEGEREIGRGCQSVGIPQIVSTSCSYPLPEVMDAVEEAKDANGANIPVFFQLYVDKDRKKTAKLLQQVTTRGVKGIFLTIDAPVIGKREADERVKADDSLKMPMTGMAASNDKKGGGMGRLIGSFVDSSLTWDFVKWLRQQVPGLPIVLKGIQTYMDAKLAMQAGVDAIYITNHGGRSLDTAPSTILVLLELQKNCPQIFDKMEVYVDGGISRGTDVFKALCLGAKAVGMGRNFLFALNYGKEGIEHLIDSEFDQVSVIRYVY